MGVNAYRAAAALQLAIVLVGGTEISAVRAEEQQPANSGAASQSKTEASEEAKETDEKRSVRQATEEGSLGGVTTKNVVGKDNIDGTNQSSFDAVKGVSAVTSQDSKGGAFADNLVIRGIHLLSTSSYRLNGGFPVANNIFMPQENKERIEILKGANALLYGIASPGGVVNLVTKRPQDRPITDIGFSGTSFGTATGLVDISRQYLDGELGIRTIAAGGHVETGVRGADGMRGFGSVAADWNPSDRFSARLDYEIYGIDVVEQSSLAQLKAVKGVVTLPHYLDPTKLMSGPWAVYTAAGQDALLSTSYQIGSGWSTLVEGGISENTRFNRTLTQVGNYNVVTGLGKEVATIIHDQETLNTYAKGELIKDAAWGPLTSHLTMGINRNERDTNNPVSQTYSWTQNIYNPVPLPAPVVATWVPTYQPQESTDVGYYVYETLGVFDRLHIVAGARYLMYELRSAHTDGKSSVVSTNVWSPAAGVTYDITPHLAAYASYMKSLDETGTAPQGAANFGISLPAAPATQVEAGIRVANFLGMSGSLAYFDITRANAFVDSVTNLFGINGNIRYRGVEGTLNLELDPRFSVEAGGQYLNAVQVATDPTINGLTPENTPTYSGSLKVTYRPEWLRGFETFAAAVYTGARPVNPQDQAYIPATTLYSLGARYTTKIRGYKSHFGMSVTNLLDQRYWSSAAQGALGIGMGRTIKFSVKVDL